MRFSDSVVSLSKSDIPVRKGIRLGIELEYEKAASELFLSNLPGWTICRDDSLRNDGIEFVSHVTLPHQLHTRLGHVENVVSSYNLDPHKRCGVHVHINTTDLNIRELWNIITLYILLEQQIFLQFAPNRTDNHFCVPLYYCENLIGAFKEDSRILRNSDAGILYSELNRNLDFPLDGFEAATNTTMTCVRACSKYSALNLKCLPTIGTLEFRHLPATTDFVLIESWCEFLCALREESLKYEDPYDILDEYNQKGVSGLISDLGRMVLPADGGIQEDSEYLAYVICGVIPKSKEDLSWAIGG